MFLHVEHHLFPQVPTCHPPALARRLDRVMPELSLRQVLQSSRAAAGAKAFRGTRICELSHRPAYGFPLQCVVRMPAIGAREQAMAITVYYATNRNETAHRRQPEFRPAFPPEGPAISALRVGRRGAADDPGGDYRVVTVRLAPEQITTPGAPAGARQPPDLRRAAHPHEGRGRRPHPRSSTVIPAISPPRLQRVAQVKQEYQQAGHPAEAAVFSGRPTARMTPWISLLQRSRRRQGVRSGHRPRLPEAAGLFPRYRAGPVLLAAPAPRRPQHGQPCAALRAPGHHRAVSGQHAAARLPEHLPDGGRRGQRRPRARLQDGALPELAQAVQIYYSATDGALSISDGPRATPTASAAPAHAPSTNLPHKITLVDCRKVNETSPLTDVRHQYYRKRPEVISDVRQSARRSVAGRDRQSRLHRRKAEPPDQVVLRHEADLPVRAIAPRGPAASGRSGRPRNPGSFPALPPPSPRRSSSPGAPPVERARGEPSVGTPRSKASSRLISSR